MRDDAGSGKLSQYRHADGRTVIQFTLNWRRVELTAEDVQMQLRNAGPEPVRQYGVRDGSQVYPVGSRPHLRTLRLPGTAATGRSRAARACGTDPHRVLRPLPSAVPFPGSAVR